MKNFGYSKFQTISDFTRLDICFDHAKYIKIVLASFCVFMTSHKLLYGLPAKFVDGLSETVNQTSVSTANVGMSSYKVQWELQL